MDGRTIDVCSSFTAKKKPFQFQKQVEDLRDWLQSIPADWLQLLQPVEVTKKELGQENEDTFDNHYDYVINDDAKGNEYHFVECTDQADHGGDVDNIKLENTDHDQDCSSSQDDYYGKYL